MSGNDILFDKFTGSGYAGSNTQLFCKYAASAKTVANLESRAIDLAKQLGRRFTGAGEGVGTRVVESTAAGVKPGSTGLTGKADELVNKLGGPKVTGSTTGTPKTKTSTNGTPGTKDKTKTPGKKDSGTTPPSKDGTSVKTDPNKPAGPTSNKNGKQGGNGGEGKSNGNNGGKDGKEKEELGALKALGIGAGLSAVGAAGAYGVHRYTREKDDKYSFLNN